MINEISDLSQYPQYINWGKLVREKKLSDDFIITHINYISIEDLCFHHTISEDFMRKLLTKYETYKDSYIWNDITMKQDLSDEFVRDFVEHIDWNINYWCWISGGNGRLAPDLLARDGPGR